jgi:hypothetical protein
MGGVRVYFVSESAHVELRCGRVLALASMPSAAAAMPCGAARRSCAARRGATEGAAGQ